MRRYQYVMRFPDRDELRLVDGEASHDVGDRFEVDGEEWVVETIARMRRWADVDRVVLRRAEDVRPQPRSRSNVNGAAPESN